MARAERLIKRDRSIIVAADVHPDKLKQLVLETSQVDGVEAYKIGISSIGIGLNEAVAIIADQTSLKVIYDHQKAGNDIPKTGRDFARETFDAGVDSVILFPFAGPATEIAFIRECQDIGLHVMVGAHMTHEQFLESEGGFIANSAPLRIFQIAAQEGVRDFVLPGNKPEIALNLKNVAWEHSNGEECRFYAPGFITQGGDITDFAKGIGEKWHAIVGSAIYEAENIHEAAEKMTSAIR